MKKLISNVTAYLLVPALFIGHFFTQHFAFLFIYSIIPVLSIIAIAIATFSVIKLSGEPMFQDSFVVKWKGISPTRRVISAVTVAAQIVYLLFFEFYIIASIAMLAFAMSLLLFTLINNICNEAKKRKIEDAVVLSDGERL